MQLPFTVKSHDVKAHLQDRSTAVVDLCSVVDAPGDVMFDLLADPHQHESIFDAIESVTAELVSEEGPVRRWRLDCRARWRFWKVGGVCDNKLWMTTDRQRGTVSFALREPGFLRKYEGTWTITWPDGRGAAATTATAAAAPAGPAAPVASVAPGATCTAGSALQSAAAPASDPAATRDVAMGPHPSTCCSLPFCSGNVSTSHSGSSSSSVGRSRVGSLSGTTEPANLTSNGRHGNSGGVGEGGIVGGGGGLASLLAAINNPFFAASSPPMLLALVRATARPANDAAAGGAAAIANNAALPPPPPLPLAAAPRAYPTTIRIRKAISPKVSPPYPINQVLKSHASGQVYDMWEGLLAATAQRLEEMEEEPGREGTRKGT